MPCNLKVLQFIKSIALSNKDCIILIISNVWTSLVIDPDKEILWVNIVIIS